VPANRVREFERGFQQFMQARRPEVGDAIRSTGKLEKDTTDALISGVEEFKQEFLLQQQQPEPELPAVPTVDERSTTDLSTPGNPLV
jgi:hypothetical protein